MLLDQHLTFSDAQAITGDAASTNHVDTLEAGTVAYAPAAQKVDLGGTRYHEILVQVVEDFDNLTSLTVDLEVDDNAAFSSAKVVASVTTALAALVTGYRIPLTAIPPGTDERYMRLNYNVVGTDPAAGAITAAIVAGLPSIGR